MKKRKQLSPDDRKVWDAVRQTVTRMGPAPAPSVTPTEPPKKAKFVPAAERLRPFEVGAKAEMARAHDVLPGLAESLRATQVQMDAKKHRQMQRGKLKPEGRIDLHGMTMDQAHPVLTEFILDAWAADKRLVLVITGKGKARDDGGPMPVRQGVLRHAVPQWLRLAPLSPATLEVKPAHVRHGGEGAYYVYLRRRR